MRLRSLWLLAIVSGLTAATSASERTNVVAELVRGVETVDAPTDTATLIVYVLDDAGEPIDEVEVLVSAAGKPIARGRSDGRGRATLSLSRAGTVRVSASEAGFLTSVARAVTLRRGGLTALVLPLEEAPVEALPEETEPARRKAVPDPK